MLAIFPNFLIIFFHSKVTVTEVCATHCSVYTSIVTERLTSLKCVSTDTWVEQLTVLESWIMRCRGESDKRRLLLGKISRRVLQQKYLFKLSKFSAYPFVFRVSKNWSSADITNITRILLIYSIDYFSTKNKILLSSLPLYFSTINKILVSRLPLYFSTINKILVSRLPQ